MYERDDSFSIPDDEDAKIWRYMELARFISLLDKKALFFARADRLGDPFEGSLPHGTAQSREQLLRHNNAEGSQEALAEYQAALPRYVFANCWHTNEHESAAMWNLHAANGKGIAVQSSFRRLRDCFSEESPAVGIGLVDYFDYDNDGPDWDIHLTQFLWKRKSFEHEREIRALVWEPNTKETAKGQRFMDMTNPKRESGMYVDVNVNALIERVYLAPAAPRWLHEVVESVASKYGLSKPVHQSDLNRDPVF